MLMYIKSGNKINLMVTEKNSLKEEEKSEANPNTGIQIEGGTVNVIQCCKRIGLRCQLHYL